MWVGEINFFREHFMTPQNVNDIYNCFFHIVKWILNLKIPFVNILDHKNNQL